MIRKFGPLFAVAAAVAVAVAAPLAGAQSSGAAGARAGAAGTHPSGLDKEYLKTSMEGDLFEIQGGRIALSRSSNPSVRHLASRLIRDHKKSYADSAKIARRCRLESPRDPTQSETSELRTIAGMRGASFNRAYTTLEVYDHEQDLSETGDEVSDGGAPAFVEDARTELPMLRMHLKLSRAAAAAIR